MKRIDAMIPSIKRNDVVDSILKAGAQGVTVVESRGKVLPKKRRATQALLTVVANFSPRNHDFPDGHYLLASGLPT